MSQKYIDGNQMMPVKANPTPVSHVDPPFARPQFVTSRPVSAKTAAADSANTYSKRAALLQQRRQNQNVYTAPVTGDNSTIMHSTIRHISAMTPPTLANAQLSNNEEGMIIIIIIIINIYSSMREKEKITMLSGHKIFPATHMDKNNR